MKRHIGPLMIATAALTLLTGCGGGGGGMIPAGGAGPGEQTLNFGSLTSRVAGLAQPPVTAAGSGAVVTGIAGGTVSSLALHDAAPTLAETQILFVKLEVETTNIYVMNGDGTNEKQLTTDPAEDYDAVWSPDRTKIAFVSRRNGNNDIFVMNADGSNQTRLTTDPNDDNGPTWSPDGTKIAFSSRRPNSEDVYVMNANGSNQTRLTSTAAFDGLPVWSPDGTRIAFMTDRDGDYDIYVMNPDGSNQQDVSKHSAFDGSPSWSPDSTRIAFASQRNNGSEIYVMNVSSSATRRLTNNQFFDSSPSWSPDGTKIAFYSTRDNGNGEIYAMNADGSSQTRLTRTGGGTPSWSPFIKEQTLIGTGGVMGTNAAGFLFGQSGKRVTSLVTFDDTLRTDVRVTAETGIQPGIPNLVFSITAGGFLNSLVYTHNLANKPIVVIGSGGIAEKASGAFVSFDASDGLVTAVLPYTATRGAGGRSVRQEGDTLVYRGEFLGVWDATGKNLAPQGATEVHRDANTGAIRSIR